MIRASVIIPVYNGENTIARAIDSALAQDFHDFEVIVVDDGSVDSTRDVVRSYGSSIGYLHQENAGPSAARNAGAAAAAGEYFAFLDADDQWVAGRLEKTVAALERNPSAVAAFCTYLAHQSDGTEHRNRYPAGSPSLQDLLNASFTILTSTITVRRGAFHRCGGFPRELRGPGFEDLFLWLLLREQGGFEHIDEALVTYFSSPFLARARKYDRMRETFATMVRERYGRAAKGLIAATLSGAATMQLQQALRRLDDGDNAGAAKDLARLIRIQPLFLLRPEIRARLFRRSNLARILKATGLSALSR